MKEKILKQDLKLRFELPLYLNDFAEYIQSEKDELYSDVKSKNRFFYESRIRRIIELILELNLHKKSKILDLGCAGGNISLSLIFYEFDVYSVDIKLKTLKWFNEKASINKINSSSILANACDLPFYDDVFDCVVATEIIEHMYNPGVLIEEIKRVLKDKGMIILSTPNRDGINFNKAPKFSSIEDIDLEDRFLPAESWYERERPEYTGARHVFEFSKNELIGFLEEHELDIDKVTRSTNKVLSNIGVKLPINYYKLLKIDEKYAGCLFNNLLYSSLIVRCFKHNHKESNG